MWILDEDGKEIWTGDDTGESMVKGRQRLIKKVKDEVRLEIEDKIRDERELEAEQARQRSVVKQRRAKEKERKMEEARRKKALLYSGKGMPAIWVPVKFQCCPACGGVMKRVELWVGDPDCSVDVAYNCNGKKNTAIEITASSRRSKGALVPGRKILDVEITERCKALEDLVAKAALNLLA